MKKTRGGLGPAAGFGLLDDFRDDADTDHLASLANRDIAVGVEGRGLVQLGGGGRFVPWHDHPDVRRQPDFASAFR